MRPDAAWFHERQRFSPVIGVIVAATALPFWWLATAQLLGDRPIGTNPAPDVVLFVAWLLVGVGLPLLFGLARLDTHVGPTGVHLRLVPFHWKFRRWAFDQIRSAEARTYSPLYEYGGWGIRIGSAGWAYNTRGNRGVQLVLRSGQRILIGSQRADELAAAIMKGISAR